MSHEHDEAKEMSPYPVVKARPDGACELYSATFDSKGTVSTWSNGGLFPFRNQVAIKGWWPRIYRISFNGNVVDATAPPFLPDNTLLQFGFQTFKSQTIDAGDAPLPQDIIYSDLLPENIPATRDTPTVLNTNFGRGWLVPFWDGQPADFFIRIVKDERSYGATASILWGYERIGGEVG